MASFKSLAVIEKRLKTMSKGSIQRNELWTKKDKVCFRVEGGEGITTTTVYWLFIEGGFLIISSI